MLNILIILITLCSSALTYGLGRPELIIARQSVIQHPLDNTRVYFKNYSDYVSWKPVEFATRYRVTINDEVDLITIGTAFLMYRDAVGFGVTFYDENGRYIGGARAGLGFSDKVTFKIVALDNTSSESEPLIVTLSSGYSWVVPVIVPPATILVGAAGGTKIRTNRSGTCCNG